MMNKILLLFASLLFVIPTYAAKASEKAEEVMKQALARFDKDDFPGSMQLFTKSMIAAEREGDVHTQIVSIGYIGNVYFNVSDFGRALQYLYRGLSLAEKAGDERLMVSFMTNLIAAYCKMGDALNARRILKRLNSMKYGKDKANFRYYLTYNIARIAFAENRYEDALKLHTEAMKMAYKDSLPEIYRMYQYCEMGEIYYRMGMWQKALEYGQKCLKPALKANDRDFLVSIYKLLGDSYAMIDNSKMSDEYNKRYLALSDSVFSRDRIYAASNDLMDYEARRTSDHITLLNRIISRQLGTIVAVLVVLVVLVLLSVKLFLNNRKLKAAQKMLVKKNDDLRKQEKNMQGMLEQLTGEQATTQPETAPPSSGVDKEQANRLLQKILAVMDDVSIISNPDFSLNMLSDAVGSNTKYVSQVINDIYGKNFKTLLNECRIREAAKRLTDKEGFGRMTIQAVYESVGYTNSVSFIRAFRNVNGMTPSEYQKASIA